MKQISVAISGSDWASLTDGLFTPDRKENAAVLLCGQADLERETRLLVQRVSPVPQDLYVQRLNYHLEISPRFYNSIVSECLQAELNPIIVHSHPTNSEALYSPSDDFGESRLLPVLQSLIPKSTPASLVVTPSSVTGRWILNGEFQPIETIRILGARSNVIQGSRPKHQQAIGKEYDRQIRAFGEEGQRRLQDLKVAIIGVGGTGSVVAEQLARAGVRNVVLVDPDVIEESNINRLFGSTLADVGRLKAEVVGRALRRLGATQVVELPDSALKQNVLMQLRDRDLIFSCVDNDRSRAILNRFAHQYLVPVIDMGIRLDGRDGQIRAAAGRVSVVGAGMVCLRCSHHTNPERIRAESLPEQERKELQREGYIMGVDEAAPAIVSLNTVVAGLGVTAGLNLFVNLTGAPQPLDQLYDATTGTIFVANTYHQPDCDVCDAAVGLKALGDKQLVSAY